MSAEFSLQKVGPSYINIMVFAEWLNGLITSSYYHDNPLIKPGKSTYL